MALASWSTKRIVAVWVAGLALEALILLAPLIMFHVLFGSVSDFRRSVAEQQARARISAVADSISLARQKDDARANRTYSITPAGDTMFALVHMPLDQPSRAAALPAGVRARSRRNVYVSLIMLGFIPTVLVVLTVSWADARRDGGAGQFVSKQA